MPRESNDELRRMKDGDAQRKIFFSPCRLSSFILPPSSLLFLVAAEGIEPSSLDYRSSALPLSYTASSLESRVWSRESKSEAADSRLTTPDSRLRWLTRRDLNPH